MTWPLIVGLGAAYVVVMWAVTYVEGRTEAMEALAESKAWEEGREKLAQQKKGAA